MSSLMRPAGPLPARVYWARRLALIGMLILIAGVAWWGLGRLTGGSADAAGGEMSNLSAGNRDGARPSGRAADHGPGHSGKHHKPPKKTDPPKHRHRPAQPTGDCTPTEVDIVVDVTDVRAGRTQPIRLNLSSVGVPACSLAITPDTLALRITSGNDVVWTSQDCPNALLARELVVRAHRPTEYVFDWDGRRSTDTCAKPGDVADPGGYWAEVALIGADVHRAYFDVT